MSEIHSLSNRDAVAFERFADQSDKGLQSFRNGMAGLGSAVNVITTRVEDFPVGFTATAVSSVTDTPPTLLVCLNRSASVFEVFNKADFLCVNTLCAYQDVVSGLFSGKKSQTERFQEVDWKEFITGAPVLQTSAIAFDCAISTRVSVGTHDIFICEVLGIVRAESMSNLVYFNRKYHHLT